MSGSELDLFGQTSQVIGRAAINDNSGNSWSGGSWWQQLQPGSWRGVGFVLDAGETRAGRRVAIHEYPYRDDVWAEDLGKLPRRFTVQAFLVGDDVYQQRDAMLAACEQSGSGTLVHPTLGTIECVLLEFATADRRERGRVVELVFTFIISSDVQFPATAIATGQAVLSAANSLTSAAQSDLASTFSGFSPPANLMTYSVSQFTSAATSAVDDASRVLGAVKGLQGFYGRYANGSLMTMQPATTTVSSALAAATTSRSAVYAAADLVDRTAAVL